jgi:hypothetical protein
MGTNYPTLLLRAESRPIASPTDDVIERGQPFGDGQDTCAGALVRIDVNAAG